MVWGAITTYTFPWVIGFINGAFHSHGGSPIAGFISWKIPSEKIEIGGALLRNKNRMFPKIEGIPKSSIFIGDFHEINHPAIGIITTFMETPVYGNVWKPHICTPKSSTCNIYAPSNPNQPSGCSTSVFSSVAGLLKTHNRCVKQHNSSLEKENMVFT